MKKILMDLKARVFPKKKTQVDSRPLLSEQVVAIKTELVLPIIACGTITKKSLNRDAFEQIRNKHLHIYGVAIADGVGNNLRVEEAANEAVSCVKTEIENLRVIEELDLEHIFKKCKSCILDKFNGEVDNDQFGTTLIVALEYLYKGRRKIKIAYIGNGAVYHIRGNFNHFDNNQPFPWNCINYLNPHSIQQSGQESLSNCLSLESIATYQGPSIIGLSCDMEFGDIIMICSDGIHSNDQVPFVKDGAGRIWLQLEESLTHFYKYLGDYFAEHNYSDEPLSIMINRYLIKLKEEDLLDDDATIGIIVLPEAIEYQKKCFNEPESHHQ